MKRLTLRAAAAFAILVGPLSILGGDSAGALVCTDDLSKCVDVQQCDPYTPRYEIRIGQTIQTSCLP